MKTYPLDVTVLSGDGSTTAFAKGHHDKGQFAEAASKELESTVSADEVFHGWWRFKPEPRDSDYYPGWYMDAPANSRGAFPVTLTER